MAVANWDPFSTDTPVLDQYGRQTRFFVRSPEPSPIGWFLIVLGLLVVCGGCACSVLSVGAQRLGQIGYPHPERPDASDPIQDANVTNNLTPEQYQQLWVIVTGGSVALAVLVGAISVVTLVLRDRSWPQMMPLSTAPAGSGLALSALIAGVLSVVLCVLPYVSLPLATLGLVLSIAATRRSTSGRSRGAGIAIAAIVVSAYGILNTGVILVYYTYVIFGTPAYV
jgi:hypothetical protein